LPLAQSLGASASSEKAAFALHPARKPAQRMLSVASTRSTRGLVEFGGLLVESLHALGCGPQVLLMAEPGTASELASASDELRQRGAASVGLIELHAGSTSVAIDSALSRLPRTASVLTLGNPLLCHLEPTLSVLLGAGDPRAGWRPSATLVAPRIDLHVATGGPDLAVELARALVSKQVVAAHESR
jgi:hypothetical protein